MTSNQDLRRLATALRQQGRRLVLAESCTSGMVAGAISKIVGISEHFCGGVVVYRNETKTAYLKISPRLLKSPGPVSEIVARKMIEGVLELTPEADVAASVTGHLGPNAPTELDGVVFIGLGARRGLAGKKVIEVQRLDLPDSGRAARQKLVVEEVLRRTADFVVGQAAKG